MKFVLPCFFIHFSWNLFLEAGCACVIENYEGEIMAKQIINPLQSRIVNWKNNLIDMSKRNTLLNFKPKPSNSVKFLDEPSNLYKPTDMRSGIMKKLFSGIFIASMLVSAASPTYAAASVKIIVNKEQVQTDVAPIIVKDRVLVPIRAVAETLGAKVAWTQKTKTVEVRKWAEIVHLTVGKNTATVEGNLNPLAFSDDTGSIALDVSVKIVNDRVYVPLRFISQLFGYQVKWGQGAVSIDSPISKWKTWVEGGLSDSRMYALMIPPSADLHYQHEPLNVTMQSEDYDSTYLFPEGEALRFYYIFRNTVSLIELQDGFPVVMWQAHIKEGPHVQQFLDGKFSDQRGTRPFINKPYLYYSSGMFGDSSWEESGRIDLNLQATRTGYKSEVGGEVTDMSGTITLNMPDEKRVEVVSVS
jgi:hypothetical protein